MQRSCKRWHYRLSRSNPATTCQDTVSAAPVFVEPTRLHHEARGVDYRGPFVVEVDDYVLVFPVIKDDEFRVPRSIPFLLAVKRPRNARVISTIAFSVTAPHRVHATGNLYTGRVPRIALDYATETLGAYFPDTGEYWPDSNEQRTAYDEEMELAVSLEAKQAADKCDD